jgi:Patatin-like phospholipase
MKTQTNLRTTGTKVLCIDGGGSRGIIPATILAHLADCIGRPLYQVFDLIAGTSTGGIIALGIGAAERDGHPFTSDAPPIKLSGTGTQFASVDGGLFVNNPAMASFAEASRLHPQANRFAIVSVGTGDRYDRLSYGHAKRWGLPGWARQIVLVTMDSVSETVDYELNWIAEPSCRGKYYRLQPRLTGVSNDMDDVSLENMNGLRAVAEKYIRENSAVLDETAVN